VNLDRFPILRQFSASKSSTKMQQFGLPICIAVIGKRSPFTEQG
jgi:hypothetical protein